MAGIERFRSFVQEMTRLAGSCGADETAMIAAGGELLIDLVGHDDWLPTAFARPDPDGYQQYLLHCDPLERFSVVSFVWGPGQGTPVHDHTVWGLIGVMRGAETCTNFAIPEGGGRPRQISDERYGPGAVTAVSPDIGDIHRVANALADKASLSIHVYGGNIGAIRRHIFDEESGAAGEFVSGYASTVIPNIWAAIS